MGPEHTWLDDERYRGARQLDNPFGAVQMVLIYVNLEGPNGKPDPVPAARDLRETLRRMAMNDYEPLPSLPAGHTFGKTHGAGPESNASREPEAAPIGGARLRLKNGWVAAKVPTRSPAGLKGAWTTNPIKWDNNYFENLLGYEWSL